MALTNEEAQAVNTLLDWFIDVPNQHGSRVPISVQHARHAACLLADHANTKLMAGIRGEDVKDHWPRPNDAGEYVFKTREG